MIIGLHRLLKGDIPKMTEWVAENSPDSKLFIGGLSGPGIPLTGYYWQWQNIRIVNDSNRYLNFTRLAIDIPDEDAVHFKLTWG